MIQNFCRIVDAVNERTGSIVALLFLPFTFLVVTDVFTRYILNKPWFYLDINVQIMGCIVLMGAGYTHLHDGHVGVDILVNRLSERNRAIFDLIISPLFLFTIGTLLWKLSQYAYKSVSILEEYTSAFAPPIYPYKIMMALGIALLMLQGIVKYIRKLTYVINTKPKG
ncbi:TRAP transporter small permease subunit [Chloroflexota bacterium]